MVACTCDILGYKEVKSMLYCELRNAIMDIQNLSKLRMCIKRQLHEDCDSLKGYKVP